MSSIVVWAPPMFWGPWMKLGGHTATLTYNVSFDTVSNAPSACVLRVKWAKLGPKITEILGPPGSATITCYGTGTDMVQAKRFSLGQMLRVDSGLPMQL